MGLAWRTGVDGIEHPSSEAVTGAVAVEIGEHVQGIGPDELERVVRLSGDVHSNHIESGTGIPGSGTPGSAEQVKEARFRCRHLSLSW
jgi:hypothetical protein